MIDSLRRALAAIGFAVLFIIPALWGFTRCRGPTTFRAARAQPEDAFRVKLTWRRGPFSSVEEFSSRRPPMVRVRPPDSDEGYAELSLAGEAGELDHPIFTATSAEVATLNPMGEAYTEALQGGALSFAWEFPAERTWWVALALTIVAPIGGAILGVFVSARRGT